MTSVYSIVEHLDSILDPAAYDDYGPNGLQVPGREEVGLVVTGVSAGTELFERAAEEGADLVLVHHPDHVGGDAALVALVETLEGVVVTRAGGGHEGLV